MNNFKPILTAFAAALLCVSTVQAGSLWNESSTNERGMFADKRAKRVGDIVTIVVQENTVATNSLELKTARDAKASTGNPVTNLINQFVKAIPGAILGKNNNRYAESLAKNGLDPDTIKVPSLSANGSAEYKGGGEITNRQVATSRAAVTVVDVLPNGNMVVEGARVVRFSGETQYACLRGIIRPTDVQKDNTVLSTNVADAQIEFVSEGTLTDAQKKGWLLRFANKVSPF